MYRGQSEIQVSVLKKFCGPKRGQTDRFWKAGGHSPPYAASRCLTASMTARTASPAEPALIATTAARFLLGQRMQPEEMNGEPPKKPRPPTISPRESSCQRFAV